MFGSPLSSDVPSALVIPRSTAVWTTLQSPTFCSSTAKKVLIESAVPVYSVYVPLSLELEFTTG